jgi:hypothetical protein
VLLNGPKRTFSHYSKVSFPIPTQMQTFVLHQAVISMGSSCGENKPIYAYWS